METNANKQSSILLCQENFASCEKAVAGSEFLFVKDDHIAVDKTLVVQKTMILKERTVLSRIQNESVVDKLKRYQPSTHIPQPRPQISSQNENLTDEMEISSQTSFMELCSQESAEKMDACSQESIISKMDLDSQENVPRVEEGVLNDSESHEMNAIMPTECYQADLKRKHAISTTGENSTDIYVKDSDILESEKSEALCETFENEEDCLSTDLKNHTLHYAVKNTKRLRK